MRKDLQYNGQKGEKGPTLVVKILHRKKLILSKRNALKTGLSSGEYTSNVDS